MLTQLGTAVLSPLGVGCLLGLLSLCLALQVRRHRRRLAYGFGQAARPARRAWWMGVLALAWLWVWSTPLTSEALRGHLERQAGPRTLQDTGSAPMMVVLDHPAHGHGEPPGVAAVGAAEHLLHAAALYHAGNARRLLLAVVPVAPGAPAGGPGADTLQRLLEDLGVPSYAIGRESRSAHAATNIRYTAQRLKAQGITSLVLVTTALHMPLARWLFEREGLTVWPAPTAFEITAAPLALSWLRLLPNAEALDGSARAFKELTARWLLG